MMFQRFVLPFLCLAALVFSSCGGGATSATTSPNDSVGNGNGTSSVVESPAAPLRRDPLSNLKLGRYLTDLDEGRVDVAGPRDWKWGPRKKDYIVWFYIDGQLPRITVKGDPVPDRTIETVTEENIQQFLKEMTTELVDKKKEEDLLAMVIGDRPCVRYVSQATMNQSDVDRQILITHVKGRRYTIDLQVRRGTVQENRDAGYAVLAGMKFHDTKATTDNSSSDEGKSTETSN